MLVTIPALPAQDVSTVQMQSSANTERNTVNEKLIERYFSYCQDVASSNGSESKPYAESADNSFYPLTRELQRLVGDKPPYDLISKLKKYSFKIIASPKHGIVEQISDAYWTYRPEWNYEGPDQAEFLVDVKGRSFKVRVNFWVMLFVPDEQKVRECVSKKFGA